MFKKGEKVHFHDGTVQTIRGRRTKLYRPKAEKCIVRGFVRGAIVDPDGTEHMGDWHENVLTEYGHQQVIRAFAGLANFTAASYMALGYQSTQFTANSDISTKATMSSEYGSSSGATTGNRRAMSGGQQTINGNMTLTQTIQWAATDVSHGVTLNAVGMANQAAAGGGSLMSMAIFASSTKGTTQALNITYNFIFST